MSLLLVGLTNAADYVLTLLHVAGSEDKTTKTGGLRHFWRIPAKEHLH